MSYYRKGYGPSDFLPYPFRKKANPLFKVFDDFFQDYERSLCNAIFRDQQSILYPKVCSAAGVYLDKRPHTQINHFKLNQHRLGGCYRVTLH